MTCSVYMLFITKALYVFILFFKLALGFNLMVKEVIKLVMLKKVNDNIFKCINIEWEIPDSFVCFCM